MIKIPCDSCAHRALCIYEKSMRENADCLREVAHDLKSVAISPFTVNIECGKFLWDKPFSSIRGGDINPCTTST